MGIYGIGRQTTNPHNVRAKEVGHLLDMPGHGHGIIRERGSRLGSLAIHLISEGGSHIAQGTRDGVF